MNHVLVIINGADIGPAANLAATLPSYSVVTCDPILVDQIQAAGLAAPRFLPWLDCPPYNQLDPAAHAAVDAFERGLDAALAPLLPGVSLQGWQHLNLYYQWLAMTWYGPLWKALAPVLDGAHVHVFVCDVPGSFYYNSFLAPTLLMWQLKVRGIEFSGYTYGALDDDADVIADLAGRYPHKGAGDILVHVPTCMYDLAYFHGEAQASGKHLSNYTAKKFHMPLPAQRVVPLANAEAALRAMPAVLQQQITAAVAAIEAALEAYLAPLLELPYYRQRQSQHLARLYRSQLVMYFELLRHHAEGRPEKLLLSDHDTGFHGPLVAFARHFGLPVLMVPHAKTSAYVEFNYRNITVLSHPLQGTEVCHAGGQVLPHGRLAYPERFTADSELKPLRTLSLLLNAPSLNGIYYTRWDAYLDGIKRIADWCEQHGVTLKLRCKPSYSIVRLLASELGMDIDTLIANARETMDEHVAGCDLCLMYDTPTSALLYFLRNGVPVLNTVVDQLSPSELSMGNPSLVPPESVIATLRRLDLFLHDPASLAAWRSSQFRAYLQLFEAARPLRQYL